MHELKIVSWTLVSWASEENSFRENSFRKHSYGEKKNRGTRFVSRPRKLVSWALVKIRFGSNFRSLVIKSTHEFAHKEFFFYPCETQKCLRKPFFTLFPEFSRVIFFFYAHLLIHFSLFSQALFIRALYFFFGTKIIFTGTYFIFFTSKTWMSTKPLTSKKFL